MRLFYGLCTPYAALFVILELRMCADVRRFSLHQNFKLKQFSYQWPI